MCIRDSRNDVEGFAKALKELDGFLPELLDNLHPTDRVIFTADHGLSLIHISEPTRPY